MIGKTISHYNILEKLGEGGMGVVYKAQDTKLKRIVALKFLPRELLRDSKSKSRFVHEAQAASALNHPNITTIHEIDEVEGECFISMEYIEGKSIKELIKDQKLSIEEILKIAIQIAEGLSKAHQKEIVHRDIKSDNILITRDGLAKIMDFGLAKLKGVTKLTKTGSTIGTLQYMSPEQAQGIEVDQRSDIFSFGVVLYEMITGQLPFKGEHEAAIIYSLVNETPEPLSRYKANVPEELQRIVDKTLQKDRSTRYQSAVDIMADLKGLQREITTSIGVEKRIFKGLLRSKSVALGILLVLVAGIVIVGLLVVKPWLMPEKVQAKSLAVLSFENLGNEVDGYLASGLAEDLAIELRKLAGFRVASSEDTRRLSKEQLLPQQVASRLNVQYALGGSLLKAGNWIRVNVEAIEEKSGEVIWSDRFDRKFTDVHEFLDEISQKIAKALKVQLSPTEQIALKHKPTDIPEAYDHYLKGRYYYYRITFRDNEFAEREFQKALQLDPNYPLAMAGLADVYLQRYKEKFDYDECWLDSSKVLIDRTLTLDSQLAEAYKARAEALFLEDNMTDALEAAEKARELEPDYDEPYITLGNIYKQRGERTKALALFDTALTLRQSVDALCGKGNIYQVRSQYDSAKAAYQAAIKLNPYHDRPYLELGNLFVDLMEGGKAESLYQRAIDVRPDHVAGYQQLCWSGHYRGRVQEAENILRGFVERFPYNWDGYKALYDFLGDWKGDYVAAVKIVEDAVIRNPNRVWPHLILASSYAMKMSAEGKSEKVVPASAKALLEVERAFALRPNSGQVLELVGYVYWNLNRLDKALEYYKRALETRPGSSSLLINISLIYLDLKEYEKAVEFAYEAVKQSPGISSSYYELRRILVYGFNKWQEYFEIIQSAAREYGDSPIILYYLSKEQCVAGMYKDAIKTSQRALEIKITNNIALEQIAIALWLSGDTEGALAKFREMTRDYATGSWIVAILKSENRFGEIEDYLANIKRSQPDNRVLSGIDFWAWVAGPYYMSMRRFDDALSVYYELRRSGEETWAIYHSLNIAKCYKQKGEIDSAMHILKELVNTSSGLDRPLLLIDLALLEAIYAKDLITSLETAEKAAESLYPYDGVTEPLLRLQYANGKVNDAAKSLEKLNYMTYSNNKAIYRKAQLSTIIEQSNKSRFLDEAISRLTRLNRGEWQYVDLGEASAYLALALAHAGKIDSARRQIKWTLKLEPERADIAYNTACTFSLIGDTTLALQWLGTAIKRGYQELWWARVDPDLDPLRKLNRFQNIMNDWDSRLRKLLERNPYSNSKQK